MGGVISIIIPVYNCENHLEKCVRSAAEQTEKNIEIILVDDGSRDRSGAICDSFAEKDSRVKVIHKKNGGAASARNAGLDAITGEYVMFADSDDWLEPDAARVLRNAAEKSGADIVRGENYIENGQNTILHSSIIRTDGLIQKAEFNEKIYPLFFKGTELNAVWKTLFRAKTIMGLRFSEQLKTAEDLLFFMDAVTRAGSFLKIDRAVYHYNTASPGLTKSGLAYRTRLQCNLAVSKALCARLDAWDMADGRYKRAAYLRIGIITFNKLKSILRKRDGFERLR